MEQYNVYLKKFKVAIAIAVAAIALLIFFISKIIPSVQNVFQIQGEYKTKMSELSDAERKLEDMKKDEKRTEIEEQNLPKAVFKPINDGLDTEAAISDEFAEILQLIRENKIKTRSVQYEYDPQDDNFIKNAVRKYHVCRVTADLIATYSQFENFLRDLYKHEHFLEISSIEITPYEKNKRILLIKFVMKLYAQRDPSSVVDVPQKPAVEEPKNANRPNSPEAIPAEPLPAGMPQDEF